MTSKDAGIRRSTAKLALSALSQEPRDMVHAKAMMLVAQRQMQVLVDDLTEDFLVAAQNELARGLTSLDARVEHDASVLVASAEAAPLAARPEEAAPLAERREPDVGFEVPQDAPIDRAA